MNDAGDSEQWKEWLKESQRESDRACAVLGAAFLDQQLRALLEGFFVDDRSRVGGLFQSNGPLSTFFSKIDMAYVLGFVSPNELADLSRIRKVRNEFAHKLHGLSFVSPRIADWCDELKQCEIALDGMGRYTRRDRFVLSVVFLANWLGLRRLGIRESRRRLQSEVRSSGAVGRDQS